MADALLRVENLKKSYGDERVLLARLTIPES